MKDHSPRFLTLSTTFVLFPPQHRTEPNRTLCFFWSSIPYLNSNCNNCHWCVNSGISFHICLYSSEVVVCVIVCTQFWSLCDVNNSYVQPCSQSHGFKTMLRNHDFWGAEHFASFISSSRSSFPCRNQLLRLRWNVIKSTIPFHSYSPSTIHLLFSYI